MRRNWVKSDTRRYRLVLAGLMIALFTPAAQAFNGLSLPGAGVVQTGMAGAGTAMLRDSAATLRNPAAGAFLDPTSTWDLAIGFPTAGYEASETGPDSRISLFEYHEGSYRSVYELGGAPSYSRNWRPSERWAWGWGFYGAGLGTTLTDGAANIARGVPGLDSQCQGDFGGGDPLDGAGRSSQCGDRRADAGIQLTRVVLGMHLSYRATDWLSIGAAPVLAAQQFSATGLAAFAPYSSEPDRLSDNGGDVAWGIGYRLGIHARPLSWLDIGLSYQPRVRTGELDRYQGLLVGGRLDIPTNFNLGVHLYLSPRQSLVLDLDAIEYREVAMYESSPNMQNFVDRCIVPRLLAGGDAAAGDRESCLGGTSGPGFGWRDTVVRKIGYEYRGDRLAWRVGYSRGGSPIDTPDALMTVIVPTVVDEHVAIGASWRHSAGFDIGFALSYAVRATQEVRNGLSNVSLRPSVITSPVDVIGGDATWIGLDAGTDTSDQTVRISMDTWQFQIGLNFHLGGSPRRD